MHHLTSRQLQILKYVSGSNTMVTNKVLQEMNEVSLRTIQNEMKAINESLTSYGIDEIVYIKGQGYFISEKNKKDIEKILVARDDIETSSLLYYTAKERELRIIFYLLMCQQFIVIEDFSKANNVSKNTTLADIKKIRLEMKQFNLEMDFDYQNGQHVIGEENAIRQWFLEKMLPLIEEESIDIVLDFFQTNAVALEFCRSGFKLKEIQNILVNIEEGLEIQYTDEIINKLIFMVLFFTERMKQKEFVKYSHPSNERARVNAKKIYSELQKHTEFTFNDSEVGYLASFLLSANLIKDDAETNHKIEECAIAMIKLFEKISFHSFKDYESLKKDLILHLKPAFFRAKFQTEWINPLYADIKKKYKDVYEITEQAVAPFEKLIGSKPSENEISFLAILFGGYLTKTNSVLVRKKKVLIVCSKGAGTSRIIEQQLKDLLKDRVTLLPPISLREYEEEDDFQADYIVSTLPILSNKSKVFVVSPILTEEQKKILMKSILPYKLQRDEEETILSSIMTVIENNTIIKEREVLIEQLKKVLFQNYQERYLYSLPSLKELLSKSRIQIVEEATDWKEAIFLASEPLRKEGFISASYQEAMVDNIKKMGPYVVISPGLALPHASKNEGAFRLGMSLLKLKKPVAFSKKKKDQVEIIIVLSVIDDNSHVNALSELTEKMISSDFFARLTKANSIEEIIKIINE